MRRAAKVDTIQPAITKALRQIGAKPQFLHTVGQGCPDLVVGYRGQNILLEIKTGTRDCDKRLTADETLWHGSWPGQVAVVGSIAEAVEAVIKIVTKGGAQDLRRVVSP